MKGERAAGLAVVIALHGAALYGLWSHRLLPAPAEAAVVFVNFITPPQPAQKPPPRVEPPRPATRQKPRPVEAPPPLLAAEAPVPEPAEPVAPLPPVLPVPVAIAVPAPPAPPPAAKPAGPVTLASDLAVVCPQRTPPSYPAFSRRLGEAGKVVLRVELDEAGRVSAASVSSSSGYRRLDETALAAVRTWRCSPAQRDGEPVRAVALQPFNFVLEGR
jgi:protein TonB